MNSSFAILTFLLSLVLAGVILLVVPDVTGWPESYMMFLALVLVAVAGAAQAVWARRQLLRRVTGLERGLSHIHRRVEQLVDKLSRYRDDKTEGRQSEDMIREMRVLQTLLGQIIGHSGGNGSLGDKGTGGKRISVQGLIAGRTIRNDAEKALSSEAENDILTIVRTALSENRVDLYLQPTVVLPSRRPLYYECFSRVRGDRDEIIYPYQYLPVAESSGLVGTLDNLLLFRCIQLIRKLGPRRPDVRFFCNISPSSIRDKEFFLQFIDYMAANRELASRLVFEFSQDELMALEPDIHDRLFALGRNGYSFALDQVTVLDLDPEQLRSWYIHFVKVDAETLLRDADSGTVRAMRSGLKKQRIDLIASKVEDEAQVLELLDLDVGFAQGYLFGEPRLSRGGPGDDADQSP